ncbi:MAG: ketosamine-3-kinase [Chitinophagaceae bacterium]|nr:MAG: ketosamine-3-kinase [Chitinophagaceae bacterium]
MTAQITRQITEQLSLVLQSEVKIESWRSLSGGSINQVYELITDKGSRYCCKLNLLHGYVDMFEAEAEGLELIRRLVVIRVPKVVAAFKTETHQVLLLEWIEAGTRSAGFWERFGKQLSQLHQAKGESFGLSRSNYMGALPQSNLNSGDWNHFFYHQRIIPQVERALEKRLLTPDQAALFERLRVVLPDLFPDAVPRLVHGDLWSGNFLCDEDEQPVLIDPAVYYGHPAVDLAMTTLFGGFHKSFYESYNHFSPLPANHRQQWDCCNLYPLLVHLNLFGKSYLGDILSFLRQY